MNSSKDSEVLGWVKTAAVGVTELGHIVWEHVYTSIARHVLEGSFRYASHREIEKPDIRLVCIRAEGDWVTALVYEKDRELGTWKLSNLGEQIYTMKYWNEVLFRLPTEQDEIVYV